MCTKWFKICFIQCIVSYNIHREIIVFGYNVFELEISHDPLCLINTVMYMALSKT